MSQRPDYTSDPVGFCREVLRLNPWDLQGEAMRALVPDFLPLPEKGGR